MHGVIILVLKNLNAELDSYIICVCSKMARAQYVHARFAQTMSSHNK